MTTTSQAAPTDVRAALNDLDWVVLTASVVDALPDLNTKANEEMAAHLDVLNIAFVPARNHVPAQGIDEPAFLIFGPDRNDVVQLAMIYGQPLFLAKSGAYQLLNLDALDAVAVARIASYDEGGTVFGDEAKAKGQWFEFDDGTLWSPYFA